MKKVLIVDDDKTLLEAIKTAIEVNGHEADVVSNGAEVIDMIRKTNPDIILLDVLLSGYDGRDIAKQIKSDKKMKTIPLVMLSASANIEEIVEEAGADGFLAKPFEIEELWDLVENVTVKKE